MQPSSSRRTSCPKESLASSAVSDGSEEEVVGFENLPGEPWKVTVPLQRTSSPSRVQQVLPAPPDPAPPSMFTMAPPLVRGVWWHTGADHKNTARTILWCRRPSTLQTRAPEQVDAGHTGWRGRAGDTSHSLFKGEERSLLQYRCSASTRSLPVFLLCWVCLSIVVDNAQDTQLAKGVQDNSFNKLFSRGHDPSTHVHRARLLTVVGEPLLSVSCVSCVFASTRVTAALSPVCCTARCFQFGAVVPSVLRERSFKKRRIGRCSARNRFYRVYWLVSVKRSLYISCLQFGGRPEVSLRSAAHSTGICKPCGFFRKVGGCQNGQLCLHCYLCPERAACQRQKARRFERALFAPSLRCACVVHSPSLMAQVVQSVERHTVEKGVVTSCLCLVSDSSSVVVERGSRTELSGVAVT